MYSVAVVLMFMIAVNSETYYSADGDFQKIGGRVYKKTLLTDKFDSPKELAYDSASRNLFFMYMDDEIQNSGRALVNVNTKETKKINGIKNNKATAVDFDTGDVYFGSDNGLYKYDAVANEATNIGLYNVNIHKLVIRDNQMYLLDANNHMLYKVYNEGSRTGLLTDMKTVMEFNVDNFRNVHIVTMCGVFCAVNGNEVIKNKDLTVVYHFVIDNEKTFGITDNAIYDIDCKNGTASKVTDIDFAPRSIIFGDYGDVYYAVDNYIYKLNPLSSYVIYNIYHRKLSR